MPYGKLMQMIFYAQGSYVFFFYIYTFLNDKTSLYLQDEWSAAALIRPIFV